MINKKIFLIILIIFLIGCSNKELNKLIVVPENYHIVIENNPDVNTKLKSNWKAEDVIYYAIEPDNRLNARNMITISKYHNDIYYFWLNSYYEDNKVKYGNNSIKIECSFSNLDQNEIQICSYNDENKSIHKYTFGLDGTLIFRILCLDKIPEFSNKHCREIAESLINKAKKLDFK
jgi:hypothetical protein